MKGYLDKSWNTGSDCVDELIGRLIGRVGDVIRIWLRK